MVVLEPGPGVHAGGAGGAGLFADQLAQTLGTDFAGACDRLAVVSAQRLLHGHGSDPSSRFAVDRRQRRLSAKLIRLGALDLYRRRDFNGAGRRFVFHLVNSSKRQVAQK